MMGFTKQGSGMANQNDCAASGVVEQDRRAVAAVVRLTILPLPCTIAAPVVEGGLFRSTIVGEDFTE